MKSARILAVLLAAAACASAPGAPTSVDTFADRLMARAASDEPETTALLEALAAEAGGEMVKLEFRLKSRKSMVRKIKKYLHEHPNEGMASVYIDDALRYTMVVPDVPAGRHVQSVAGALGTLEARGHTVRKVKNYWPPGDNYSGVNTVLENERGLTWELQFHTPQSVATNELNRSMYEELREIGTPIERKRELFQAMTANWAKVPIPHGILEPANLHPIEQIKSWGPP